mmetsp:Transcript_2844/g.8577  ORF Transcript_2844/g.8577 Transcript_2844/m.8577 type:complete len:210 (-) Transcript_2844:93-722(-)
MFCSGCTTRPTPLTRYAHAGSIIMREQMGTAANPAFDIRALAGVSAPLGFWDPLNFSVGETEGKIRFYREVEIKHGRVAMLAALGFVIGEQWHPLWGGGIDAPSYIAFQETPLQIFWPAVVMAIGLQEASSVFTFQRPFDFFYVEASAPWLIKTDHSPGDLKFDPLGLKPTDPAELLEMETKELNHGRAAMFGIAGMVAQELVTGEKLF